MMNRFIVWLLTVSLAINHLEVVKANLHYSYNKEDHNHHHPQPQPQQQHHQLTPAPRRIYKVVDFDNKENNQASKLKMANTQSALAHEPLATYSIYGGQQPQQLQLHLQPTLQSSQQQVPQQQIPSEPYSTKFPSVQYNVLQHIDDGDIDIVYHQSQPGENHIEATQQEKPSLLAQLKSQQQELSEGYATFLQETPNGSSGDNEQRQQKQQPQVNPLFLHYQKLQQQQQLYYQQLQQQEQQHAQHQQEQQQYQVTQQQQPLQQHQQISEQQPSQHHLQYQQQQQQLQQQEPPHAIAAYITPTPPPTPSPVPTTTQATTTHPNLHHRQQPSAIVSPDATGNEASPPQTLAAAAINPHPKPYQRQPPYHQQRNKQPAYASAPGFKYVPHNKPYNHLPPPRHPATVYGPPPLPHGSKHSKQVIYAPMRFVYDRKLPYSTKTFPYPPSFISLTTTEKPMKSDHGNSNYYTYDHKAAYNKKVPDFFVHRSPKSLLDSYIPSWQVIKMLQHLQYPNTNANQNTNLHTLAQPFRRNFKRNAVEPGQQ